MKHSWQFVLTSAEQKSFAKVLKALQEQKGTNCCLPPGYTTIRYDSPNATSECKRVCYTIFPSLAKRKDAHCPCTHLKRKHLIKVVTNLLAWNKERSTNHV